MILPGFEPGTPAVSEQCSNRAELQDLKNLKFQRFINIFIKLKTTIFSKRQLYIGSMKPSQGLRPGSIPGWRIFHTI